MKYRISFIALLLAAVICFAACVASVHGNEEDSVATESEKQTAAGSMELAPGLFIKEVFSYTGKYVEDGSNDECNDICAVRLVNESDTHYQYIRFSVETTGGSYSFSASTLFSGAEMTVLCEGKVAFTGSDILSCEALSLASFQETPSVHLDTLNITYTDGFINVKNVSESDITGLYVYYKNRDGESYLGGITYRAEIGDITAGQIVQTAAGNIHSDSSTVVFVTYDHP